MESRLLIYYFTLGGLVGLTGQDLRQLNDDRRLKMPEYRERTLDRKLPSSTKRDDSHFGLSTNLLPFEINTNDIALIKPKSYVDGKKRNVIKRNAMVFKNLAVNKKCKMKVDQRTVSTFIYRVWRFESRYVFMGLRPENGSGIKIRSSPDVINGNIWTWTFWDKNEAQEFLRWPIEFGIWSMGILYHSVLRQPQVLPVVLKRVSGDCSHLTVGNVKDDLAISRALNAITLGLMRNNSDGEKYGPSYYCYSRKRNVPAYMQIICENIVCPFEGIEKECCVYRFNRTNMKRNVICPEFKYIYDTISWNVPILLAIILFIYFPMLLLFVAHKFFDSVRSTYVRLNRTEQGFTESDDSYHEQGLNGHNHTVEIYLLEGYKHVSFFQTLFMPLASLKRVTVTLQKRFLFLVVGRLTRVVFPFITLSIIGIQAYVDYSNLKNFIKTSVKLGVPYGLRSIITGYEMSRTNFLPFLGGPFVALACYVVVTTVLLMIPKSLPEFLAKGLGPKLNGQCANANNTELHPMSEIAVILFLMWVAIDLLTKTNKFKDLHTIMHVGTAIIVCAMPQILKRMCHQRESKLLRREFRKKLAATILSHLGYFVYNEETSGDNIRDYVCTSQTYETTSVPLRHTKLRLHLSDIRDYVCISQTYETTSTPRRHTRLRLYLSDIRDYSTPRRHTRLRLYLSDIRDYSTPLRHTRLCLYLSDIRDYVCTSQTYETTSTPLRHTRLRLNLSDIRDYVYTSQKYETTSTLLIHTILRLHLSDIRDYVFTSQTYETTSAPLRHTRLRLYLSDIRDYACTSQTYETTSTPLRHTRLRLHFSDIRDYVYTSQTYETTSTPLRHTRLRLHFSDIRDYVYTSQTYETTSIPLRHTRLRLHLSDIRDYIY
ncbi:uncharacterized protein LOC128243951 [Mya arenaria]|uniref:uncharacterized protein LOC128243951 n=1 Tax=Mya arenaria TaxID=6604 RepID=UPI0022DEDC6D|nr:uncharacterized protein LOC128243951 [Mya arenaria]